MQITYKEQNNQAGPIAAVNTRRQWNNFCKTHSSQKWNQRLSLLDRALSKCKCKRQRLSAYKNPEKIAPVQSILKRTPGQNPANQDPGMAKSGYKDW